ncbi:MAG TPA: hypothetical protein VF316_10845, partial [Polyangiaceae bacterium]
MMSRACCYLVLGAMGLAGCRPKKEPVVVKVVVKTDTPQAVVASLMKLYDAQEESRLSEVVDPAAGRIEARVNACTYTNVFSVQYGNL